MLRSLDEQFSSKLIRVIKKVKRRGGSGEHHQSFHVKKASPGDRYAAPVPVAADVAAGEPVEPEAEPVPAEPEKLTRSRVPVRIAIPRLAIKWKERPEDDPIPDEIRKRFDDPITAVAFAPDMFTAQVDAADPVQWGADEQETLYRLRSGSVTRLTMSAPDAGAFVAVVEATDGSRVKCLLQVEALRTPHVDYLWGKRYRIDRMEGGFSKRAAAAYEVAKAIGMDSQVPPTAFRVLSDREAGLVLSSDLIESRSNMFEHISRITGKAPYEIKRLLAGFASCQLLKDGFTTIDREPWFAQMFAATAADANPKLPSDIFSLMDDTLLSGFVRAALFDFVIWNGDRGLGDMLFSPGVGPLLFGNEVSFPGSAVVARDGGESSDPVPALWSWPLMLVRARGDDRVIDMFEAEAINIAASMKGEAAKQLAASLLSHGIDESAVAGVFSRTWLLDSHSREIAKDPGLVPTYYAQLIAGEEMPEFQGVSDYVNAVMKAATLAGGFDFQAALKGDKQ